VDRPVAVVDAVNTATPVTLMVHVDHLNRPVRMTNSAKASVWDVIYTPWGAFHSATGAQTLNTRFPGQWFQLESGLHYNWHRHYDPSLGRYTQPDPLGFVDGPSVYAYAGNSPTAEIDFLGLVGGGLGGKPLGDPGTIQPDRLPPPPPKPELKLFCDVRLARCLVNCAESKICQKLKPAAFACGTKCAVSYTFCRFSSMLGDK
jgi:RHS repeat-associated protein